MYKILCLPSESVNSCAIFLYKIIKITYENIERMDKIVCTDQNKEEERQSSS